MSYIYLFRKNLKSLRLARGLRQVDIERMAGIAHGTVYNYECGKGTPTLQTFLALCECLRVHPRELFTKNLKTRRFKRGPIHEAPTTEG